MEQTQIATEFVEVHRFDQVGDEARLATTALVFVHSVTTEEAAGREVIWKSGDLPTVEGDPALLRQVMINLLANALKYAAPEVRRSSKRVAKRRPASK